MGWAAQTFRLKFACLQRRRRMRVQQQGESWFNANAACLYLCDNYSSSLTYFVSNQQRLARILCRRYVTLQVVSCCVGSAELTVV